MCYHVANTRGSINLVVLTSAFDAVPYVEKKYQVVICFEVCILYLCAALQFTKEWIYGPWADFTKIQVTQTLAFSIADICINMCRTIFLFYAKMTFSLWMRIRKKSNGAVNLKFAPIIEWKADERIRRLSMQKGSNYKVNSKRKNSVQIDVITMRLSMRKSIVGDSDEKEPIHSVIQLS